MELRHAAVGGDCGRDSDQKFNGVGTGKKMGLVPVVDDISFSYIELFVRNLMGYSVK